jgi:hypothetical protein
MVADTGATGTGNECRLNKKKCPVCAQTHRSTPAKWQQFRELEVMVSQRVDKLTFNPPADPY